MLNRITFEGLGRAQYVNLGFRAPKKGEYYLSGAVVQAYKAPNDLGCAYHVVAPKLGTVKTFAEMWG